MAESIVMLGGGGHALVVAEAALLAGFRVVGLYDDHLEPSASRLLAIPRLGGFEEGLAGTGTVASILAVGDIPLRARLLAKLARSGSRLIAPPIVHPSAVVHSSATVGRGVYIGPTAVVHSFAVVGDHAIINSGAIVEHESHVGANAHVAPGAVLGGRVIVGPGTLVGLGSRVLPNVSIGADAVIGAGTVVIREVAAGMKVAGSPARPIGLSDRAQVPQDQPAKAGT
jgi:UDP-perosamine 4-acetyltransferase